MPTQQDITDIIMDVSSDLVKLEANEQKVILKKLKDMEKDLISSLNDINPAASNSQLKRKKRTLEAIAQSKIITKSYYSDIKKYNQGQLFEVAKFSNRHIVQEINKLYGVEKMTTVMTANKLKALVNDQIVMGEKLTEFWDGQTSKVVKSYRNQLQLGLLSNDTFNQLERRIRGTREMKFRDGIMQVPNNQAKTYIRTSIQNTANAARTQTYRDNDSVVDGEEWFATLDLRTSVICAALDGLKWTYPDYKPVGHNYAYPGPIAHPNCRSTQLPTIEGIDEEGGTRASMYGQVSGKTTYEDWLKNPPERMLEEAGEMKRLGRPMTPEEFQNMKLGTWKAEQFRQGKVGLRDLVSPKNKNGQPLVYNIDELKSKYKIKDSIDVVKIANRKLIEAYRAGRYLNDLDVDKVPIEISDKVKLTNDRVRKTIKGAIDDSTDNMRQVMLTYGEMDRIDVVPGRKSSYDFSSNIINISEDIIKSGKHRSIVHEIMHVVDFKKAAKVSSDLKTGEVLSNWSVSKEFKDLFKKAKKELLELPKENIEAMVKTRGISGIFSALSEGKIKGDFGHQLEYYKEIRVGKYTEFFACLGEIYADKNRKEWNMLSDNSKTLTKIYTKLIKML